MKIIEERAVIAAIADTTKGRTRDDYTIAALADHENGFREGYIQGAKEQQKIDIDKAIKFTCDKCECFANGIAGGYKICSLHSEPKKTCRIVKALIEAMGGG